MAGRNREQISSVELWCTIFIYIVSTAVILPVGVIAGRQVWISGIIAILISVGFAFVYTSLCDAHPGKSLVRIGESLIGSIGGKIIGLLYAWYFFLITANVLKDNWYFSRAVAFPNTPAVVLTATMMIIIIWMTYAGLEAMSRVAILFVPVVFFYTILSCLLLSKDMELRNLLPIIENNWRQILYGSMQISTVPFGGSVLFTMIFSELNKKGHAKVPSLLGVAASGILVLIVNVVNILVLGPLTFKLLYPTYTVYSYIQAADFLDRAEIMIYSLFIAINCIKMSILLYATARPLAEALGLSNYRILLIPLGLLTLEQSVFLVRSQAEFVSFAVYSWPWFALVFSFSIPLLLFIISSIKKKRNRIV